MKLFRFALARHCSFVVLSVLGVGLASCGTDSQSPVSVPSPTPASTLAEKSDVAVGAQRAGPTPFIAFLDLAGTSTAALTDIGYTIDPMPGTISKPVKVSFSIDYLRNSGRISGSTVTVPVFGLYANRTNSTTISLQFTDKSIRALNVAITTPPYEVASPFRTPVVNIARQANLPLGFDFFLMKPNNPVAPVTILDGDGNIRWVSTTLSGAAVLFRNNGIDIADTAKPLLYREELDGRTSTATVGNTSIVNFHHDLSQGPQGILAEPNVTGRLEDYLVELAPNGTQLKAWDLAAIIEDYMRSQGDDPSNFVRRGVDWFHINSAIYDARDRSVIVSGREDFVMKLDYDTGAIKWIFGDTSKYWYSFPSLRAKALTLAPGGLAPIGQHALSIAPDGQLVMFNDGLGSANMPAGAPAGETRSYSAVTGFFINPVAMTATPGLTFDDGRSVYSAICSSVYLAPDGSMLINYSHAANGTVLRMKGITPQGLPAFDYSYMSSGCAGGWNSVIVPFDNLRFTS